jgi:predicted phage tail protein
VQPGRSGLQPLYLPLQNYTGLTEGSHTLEVRATDAAGSADTTPASRTWTVDTIVPTAQPPAHGFVTDSQLGDISVPVKLTWSATDGASGVSKYQLQQSIDRGVYADVALPTNTTTNITASLTPGSTYQFRVRAMDGAGNWGEWAFGPEFVVGVHQETSSAITYSGTWTQQVVSSAYGGVCNTLKFRGPRQGSPSRAVALPGLHPRIKNMARPRCG